MRHQYFLMLLVAPILFDSCNKPKGDISWDKEWEAEIYPTEHQITTDSISGAKLIYVTTDGSNDYNLYFDYNCWFKDQSAMFFISDRNGISELFAYVPKTGELISVKPDRKKNNYWMTTVDFETHHVYVRDDDIIYAWKIDIKFNSDSTKVDKATVKERKIASAPKGTKFYSALTQSADRKYLSASITYDDDPDHKEILSFDILSGQLKKLMSFQTETVISHVQFNKYNPNYLRFSKDKPGNVGLHRMWVVDVRNPGKAEKIYLQEPQESVTHEDWWVNDQLTFCSGYRKGEFHVKVINIHDQVARIIGAGSWWENGSKDELAEYNWWHASGSRNGKWVVADNWHGHIGITDARTSHMRLLTKNHRTYGGGAHPHVGWAPDSKSVEFTSHKLGDPNVCIAYLPEVWNEPFMEGNDKESNVKKKQSMNKYLPKPKHGNTYVIAHRGAHIGIPENTLAAFQKAIDLGCDFIEVDTRKTKDGRIVSVHNSTVDAYVNGITGKVGGFTLAELKAMDIGSRVGPEWRNERIPTFEEILQLCHGQIGIYLDLKENLVPELVELIKKYNMVRDVVWYMPASFMKPIKQVQDNCYKCLPMPDPGSAKNIAKVAKEVQPQVIATDMGKLNADYMKIAHENNLIVFVDEDKGNTQEWQRILDWGTEGIQTNKPEELIRFLKEKNK